MGSLEEELPPGHDEEVLEWAENYDKGAYGSLMVQINEVLDFVIIMLMRTVILYHSQSEFAGKAEDFKRDFENRHPDKKIELLSLETVQGAEMAKLYDIVRYPAIVVMTNEGHLQKFWQDQPFPLMDEVFAYYQ
jgi:hypothetical protein